MRGLRKVIFRMVEDQMTKIYISEKKKKKSDDKRNIAGEE